MKTRTLAIAEIVTGAIILILALAWIAMGAPPARAFTTDPDPTVTVTVAWVMPAPEGGWSQAPYATWPQTLAGDACGSGWLQEDTYTAPQSAIDAILADGTLTRGEDWDALDYDSPFPETDRPWRFVAQAPCPEPTSEPTATPTAGPEPIPAAPATATPAVAVEATPGFTG
jgi:hypothetical protein